MPRQKLPISLATMAGSEAPIAVRELVAAPAGGARQLEISAVVPVADAAELDGMRPGDLVLVLPSWDAALRDYRLDVVLRRIAEGPAAGVLFLRDRALPRSALGLVERAGLPLAAYVGAAPAWEVAFALDRHLRAPSASAQTRLIDVAAEVAIHALDPAATAASTRARAEEVLGRPLPDETTPGEDALLARILRPALDLVAARENERSAAAIRSRAEALTAVLLSGSGRLPEVALSAVSAGLHIPRSHVAARLRAPARASTSRAQAERTLALARQVETTLLMRDDSDNWTVAVLDGGVVVVCSVDLPPPATAALAAAGIDQIAALLDDEPVNIGIGSPQSGAEGLRRSAAEARLALETGRPVSSEAVSITGTDRAGLRRVLSDVSASALSGSLLADAIRGLTRLPPARARTAVETLAAYLDHQSSPRATARTLGLHPNAVVYRLRWIQQALDLDLGDPDERLAVHLACRAALSGEQGGG